MTLALKKLIVLLIYLIDFTDKKTWSVLEQWLYIKFHVPSYYKLLSLMPSYRQTKGHCLIEAAVFVHKEYICTLEYIYYYLKNIYTLYTRHFMHFTKQIHTLFPFLMGYIMGIQIGMNLYCKLKSVKVLLIKPNYYLYVLNTHKNIR